MRQLLAQVMEVCGFGLVVAGVFLVAGAGVALIVAGVLVAAAAVVVGL